MGSVLWRALRKNRTLRYGAPMLLLIIGGSFGLREFTQIRYDAQKMQRKIDPALEGIIKKNKVTLESEFEKMNRNLITFTALHNRYLRAGPCIIQA
ncbi:cytochrome c oxidase assembly protein COX16 homolog, mitochondrial isoform X3 [Ascaphus truei]|uniref:cytochrome c oxidase assembly protein COX16 homolog, mitochondrial isoform X3 n=1 Tax=Ascaphus truei TaxID=8439 RepID=UPI003F59FC5A